MEPGAKCMYHQGCCHERKGTEAILWDSDCFREHTVTKEQAGHYPSWLWLSDVRGSGSVPCVCSHQEVLNWVELMDGTVSLSLQTCVLNTALPCEYLTMCIFHKSSKKYTLLFFLLALKKKNVAFIIHQV